ncbi:MAG: hypothetical protein LIP04_11790 [Tannerellaceae bacterium]|nr:hypothetical protein [Tannerellaceae bacterium]
MKKIIGLCLVMLMAVSVVFAQDDRRDRDLLQEGEDPRTEQIIRALDLNGDQAEAYRNLENEYREKMRPERNLTEEQRESMKERREQNRENMENMRNEKNQRMKEILNDEQYNKYLEMEKNWESRGDRPKRNKQ